jgi:hypothetical protein
MEMPPSFGLYRAIGSDVVLSDSLSFKILGMRKIYVADSSSQKNRERNHQTKLAQNCKGEISRP